MRLLANVRRLFIFVSRKNMHYHECVEEKEYEKKEHAF